MPVLFTQATGNLKAYAIWPERVEPGRPVRAVLTEEVGELAQAHLALSGQGRNRASPMRVRPQRPGGQAKSHMTARLKAKSSTPVKAMMAMMKTTTTVK